MTNRVPAALIHPNSTERRSTKSFSIGGLLLGTLFFSASLTPTLLPRGPLIQGVLSGLCLAAGYAIGVSFGGICNYVGLALPKSFSMRVAGFVAAIACAGVAIASLHLAAGWQNSIRELMGLESVDTTYPFKVIPIALAVFAMSVVLARLFRLLLRFTATKIDGFLPKRVSRVVGFAVAATLSWSIADGVLLRGALAAADAAYMEFDKLIEQESGQPTDPLKTGSSASLINWYDLGRAGREFISSGPTRHQISAFLGGSALEPIRVYVGLRSAPSPEARARLALEELKRVGGFERPVLIVITPTGTGWVDPAALDSVEYLHHGAVASVALQYSYVGSWVYLLAGADYGVDSARALFREIYEYWITLPRQSRPKLYLYGLSLGAKNSEQSTDLIDVRRDPLAGALWSGPLYSSRLWRTFTDLRNPGSPAWLPRFGDGSFVRFMNQHGESAATPRAVSIPWGPIRIVYLQYASDPATFFEYRSLYRQPDWMVPPRGPDVSPQMRWYPIVTLLQLMADKFMSTEAPIGFGHVYAPGDYIDAWIEVTDVRGWSPDDIARLKQHLSEPKPIAPP
ncbi:MAG TPA: alpha/beta-hydrolase family protein [Pseudolabrys sp.]|nr:alpha/beta-hydrolase family protein [Pseudolabrys sp.]